MSLHDLLLSDVGDVFLNTSDHARTIAVIPSRGVDAVAIIGIWDVIDQDEVDRTRGREIVLKAKFESASRIALDSRATVDDLLWTCIHPGALNCGTYISHWTASDVAGRAPSR